MLNVPLIVPGGGVTGHGPGRFSQVAVAAYGNILFVSGGYKGSVLADLMAYTVMLPIAKNKVHRAFLYLITNMFIIHLSFFIFVSKLS